MKLSVERKRDEIEINLNGRPATLSGLLVEYDVSGPGPQEHTISAVTVNGKSIQDLPEAAQLLLMSALEAREAREWEATYEEALPDTIERARSDEWERRFGDAR
jgi:hypothetical protein